MIRFVFAAVLCVSLITVPAPLAAASAKQIINKVLTDSASDGTTAFDIMHEIEKAAAAVPSDSDRRSLYTFLGSLNEQLGLFSDASRWYASAAGIAASPASGTQLYTSEQLVLAAVRTSLSGGEYSTAESYLASIRNSKNTETAALVKLYTVWVWLCKSEDPEALHEPVVLLESYASMSSMESVRPSVYFTLWYVTGKSSWGEKLLKEYPDSPECAIIAGTSSLYPAPFWFFVPRFASAEAGSKTAVPPAQSAVDSAPVLGESAASDTASVVIKQQVGFFRNRANAEDLVQRLQTAGFAPVVSEEKRASGTVYFIVTVPEDSSGKTGLKLKSAGFECYPVFAE